ncbi:MAG: TIGR03663 family protein, partial [Chloroflexota bacterium]|nr:TIGR03663 family protein [Chloroflexota bacterium]
AFPTAEERAAEHGRGAPRSPGRPARITLEAAIFVVIGLLALLTRFFDLGSQAQHHDESLHSYFSWLYYTGQGYTHDPLMHGPFLFHVAALSYFLFGDSDATSRYGAALFGAATVVLPWFLRRELGRWGAIIASVMLLLSPSFLYFGRFHRHDVFSAFLTLLLFVAIVRYIAASRPAWALIGAAAWGFLFTNKEDFYIVTAIFGSALVGAILWSVSRRTLTLGVGLVAAVGLVAKILPGPLGWPALPRIPWDNPTNSAVRDYVVGLLSHPIVLASLILLIGFFVLASMILARQAAERGGEEAGLVDGLLGDAPAGTAAAALGALLRDRRLLWTALGLAALIYTVLYTSFFTNIPGILSGSFGAIGYWLGQQGVQRAEQPWFYYLLLLPQYDPLAAILGGAGVALTGWRLLAHRLFGWSEGPRPFARGFIAYWTVASVAIYSWAGEKMPWMDIHLVLPLTLIAAALLGSALNGLIDRGSRIAEWGTAGNGSNPAHGNPHSSLVVGGLILAAAVAWFVRAARLSAGGVEAGENWWALLVPALAIAALTIGYGALGSWDRAGRTATLALAGAFLLFHVHAGWSLAFETGDVPKDMLVYVQTSPDVTRVMDELDEFSALRTGGKDLRIMYDDNTSWPFQWYLRDYRNKQYIGNTLAEPPPDEVAIVLVGNENLAAHPEIAQNLGDYAPQQYSMRWHFPEEETYRPFALAPELKPGRSAWRSANQPHGPLDVARSVLSSLAATAEPEQQARLFRLLAYRDLTMYGPIGSYDFTIFVRKDLLPEYNAIRYR